MFDVFWLNAAHAAQVWGYTRFSQYPVHPKTTGRPQLCALHLYVSKFPLIEGRCSGVTIKNTNVISGNTFSHCLESQRLPSLCWGSPGQAGCTNRLAMDPPRALQSWTGRTKHLFACLASPENQIQVTHSQKQPGWTVCLEN